MKKKRYDDDDDRTIVNMNVEGIKGYVKEEHQKNINEIRELNLTKSEKRAIFWGSFKAMIPLLGIVLVGFGITIFFIWLWLKGAV